ncbi:MAG TPA: PIG-L family deacetylase [Anaerolineales bacterium]|jgi:LmbE family N-acetylglucosaminyl deacetylase
MRAVATVDWIYLSAHLDDAVFSCGGLIWEQAQAGEKVDIWTVCAGDPPPGSLSTFAESLHARWKAGRKAVSLRREEDLLSCRQLGAVPRHFSIPDCIYRRSPLDGTPLYSSDPEIFGSLHPLEAELAAGFSRELKQALPREAHLACPLGLGGHVDHQFVRAAAEASGRPLWYYADYPYVLERSQELEGATAGMQAVDFPISRRGLQAWEEAIAAYDSQVGTFWADLAEMRSRLHAYQSRVGGVRLWRRFA